MASNTSDDGSNCPICFEIYKEPKALACLHTFCKTCIHDYILKSKEKGLLCDGIECPLCRFMTTVDKDDPPEKWAESLRPNFALATLLESTTFSQKSAEKDERLCQPCLKQDNSNSATLFCSVCNERMCRECKKVHDSLEFTKNHESVEIEKSDNVEFLSFFQTFQRCEQHGKKVKFYCKDEDKLCCSTCAISAHRKCKGLVEISEIAIDKSNSIQCSILSKQMSELENTMKIYAAHFVSESKKLTSQESELMDGLKQLREKVNQRFDELEDKLKGEMNAVQASKASEIIVNAVECDEIACEMRRLKHILKNAIENGTEEQVFFVMKKIWGDLVRRKSEVALKFAEVESVNLTLDVSKAIDNVLNPCTELVTLSAESKKELIPSCSEKTLIFKAEAYIKQDLDEDMKPRYHGLGFLSDGRIVAVDYNNKKCVVINERLEKVGETTLKVTPLNVCVTDNNCVIITTGTDRKLCLYQVNEDNTLTEKRTIPVTHSCDSLFIVNRNECVVSTFGYTEPVHMLNFEDGVLTKIGVDFKSKQFANENCFKCSYTEDTEQLLITDKKRNSVYVFDLVSGSSCEIQNEYIVKPRGITHYMNDSYFICSYGTDSVVQMTSAGQILSVHRIIKGPRSISISHEKDKLLVSNNQKSGKKLMLFEIQ